MKTRLSLTLMFATSSLLFSPLEYATNATTVKPVSTASVVDDLFYQDLTLVQIDTLELASTQASVSALVVDPYSTVPFTVKL